VDHFFNLGASELQVSFDSHCGWKQNEKAARQQGDLFFFKGE
jgi:hypothetical protein